MFKHRTDCYFENLFDLLRILAAFHILFELVCFLYLLSFLCFNIVVFHQILLGTHKYLNSVLSPKENRLGFGPSCKISWFHKLIYSMLLRNWCRCNSGSVNLRTRMCPIRVPDDRTFDLWSKFYHIIIFIFTTIWINIRTYS